MEEPENNEGYSLRMDTKIQEVSPKFEFYEARKTGTDQVSGMEQTGGAARETVCN